MIPLGIYRTEKVSFAVLDPSYNEEDGEGEIEENDEHHHESEHIETENGSKDYKKDGDGLPKKKKSTIG